MKLTPKFFILIMYYFFMPEKKSFETFIILLGLFLVLAEFFNFNTNLGLCYGNPCLPQIIHYLVVLAGIGLVVWGTLLLNPPLEEEWLAEWEE